MGTVKDVIDAATGLAGTVEIAASAVSAAPTDSEARNVSASMAGAIEDAKAVLDVLETLDEESQLAVDDASALITLWRWRRGLLRAVSDLAGQARAVRDAADELANGKRVRVVVTKEGDTLQRIAARELGNWAEWPRILAANPDVPPGAVPSGLTLILPEKR